MRAPVSLIALSALALCLFGRPSAAQDIKLATLVPEGSVWDKTLRQMDADWRRSSGGSVKLRLYAGGVAGDEPDIVRKMRIGQLHAATLTTMGLGMLDESFQVFTIPLFFESDAEVRAVVEQMTPLFAARLEERGYVLVQWGHTGWVRFFTTKPARSIAELKRLKMFVWAGDDRMLRWWRESGFTAVPLSVTDILTGLQTGMIEALPSTPLAALALQWFRSAPNMIDARVVPLLGATVISKRVWDKIPEAQRPALLAAARKAQDYLFEEIPRQEEQAVAEMRQRGLSLVRPEGAAGEVGEAGAEPWRELALTFAERMQSSQIPPEIFARAREARDAFRAAHAGRGPQGDAQ